MAGKTDRSGYDERGVGGKGIDDRGNTNKSTGPQQTALPPPSSTASSTLQNQLPPPIDLVIPHSDAADELDISEAFFENLVVKFAYAYELFFRPYKLVMVEFRDQYLQTERNILLHVIAPFTKDYADTLAEKFVFGGKSFRKKEFDDHNFEYNETERIYMEKIKRKINHADSILNKVENEGISSTSPPLDIAISSIREIYLVEIRKALDIASLGLRLIAIYNEAARASLASTDLNIDRTPRQKDPLSPNIIDPEYIRDNKFHKVHIPNVLRYLKAVLDEQEQKVNISSLTIQVDTLQKQIESNIKEFTKQAKMEENIRKLFMTVEVMITIIQLASALQGRGGDGGPIPCALAVGGIVRYSNGGAKMIAKSLSSIEIAELIKAGWQGGMVISAMAMSSGGSGVGNVPNLENIRGKTPGRPKRDGALLVQRGVVVRNGPGGIIQRTVRKFTKIMEDKSGFEAAKSGFFRDLAKDLKVREFFGEGSPELTNLENGLKPSEYWEVHHNIPVTAKVNGVITNHPSNFSLMPKWVHNSVTAEYSRMLKPFPVGGSGNFAFPIFDRVILWRKAFLPLKLP